jgi:hypothetical protein
MAERKGAFSHLKSCSAPEIQMIRRLIFHPYGLLHPEGGTLRVWVTESSGLDEKRAFTAFKKRLSLFPCSRDRNSA